MSTDDNHINYKVHDRFHLQSNSDLQAHLSRAIGSCCLLDRNCYTFGRLDVVLPISKYIHSNSKFVKENVTFALHGLSGDAANCVTMESCGVVPVR